MGGKPYAARYYITAERREALDELTRTLFGTVRMLDGEGKNLLYSNQLEQ